MERDRGMEDLGDGDGDVNLKEEEEGEIRATIGRTNKRDGKKTWERGRKEIKILKG